MSTVTGPDFVALQVRDLERAAAFYEQRLGLRRAPGSPSGAVVFATEPIPFAVRDRYLARTSTPEPAGSGWRCGCASTTLSCCTTALRVRTCRS